MLKEESLQVARQASLIYRAWPARVLQPVHRDIELSPGSIVAHTGGPFGSVKATLLNGDDAEGRSFKRRIN